MIMESHRLKLALAGALLLGCAGSATAQDEVEAAIEGAEDRVSGSIGVDLATHFVSYGFDVWGAGNNWNDATVFVWGEVSWDFDLFTLTGGVWSDNNNNIDSAIGGPIQEIDVYIGIGFEWEKFSFGATYQEWFYASITEHIVDLSVAYDDSDLLFDGFAFSPSIVYHNRTEAEGLDEGAVLVFGIEPSFTVVDSEDYPVTLSIPLAAAFGTYSIAGDNEFYDDDDEFDFAYASVGATVGVPLAFIPAEYGDWAASANLTYYLTDEDEVGNPRDNFLTGMLSLSMGF